MVGNLSLCPTCKGIDIERIFKSAAYTKLGSGRLEAPLTFNCNALSSGGCDLCEFFRIFQMTSGKEHHIQAFSVFGSYPGVSYRHIPHGLRVHDSIFLAVVPGLQPLKSSREKGRAEQKIFSYAAIINHCWKTGFISLCPDPPSQCFHGRRVSKFVDYSILKEWIAYCKKSHGQCRPSLPPPGLRLIDCEEDSPNIVPAPLFCEYVALSYVWGTSQNGDSGLSQQMANGSSALPPCLPNVINDAITVTRKLGKRFLWIDKYCINQRNKDEMQDAFDQMHRIYRGAYATIFAAAGEGQEYGLPGVGNLSRINQPTVVTSAGTLVSTLGHPIHSIKSSAWSSRGWTYQEAVFSKRRLFFTKEQVYFECDSMNCYESLHTPLDLLHTKGKARFQSFMRSGLFSGTEGSAAFGSFDTELGRIQPMFPQYVVHLKHYTARNLTHDYDSLNAFRGVMEHFQKASISKIWHIWGVPFIPYRSLQTNSLAVSLTWHHSVELNPRTIHRRNEFPSWTWAGWAAKIQFPLADVYRTTEFLRLLKPDQFEHDITDVALFGNDGTRHPLRNIDCQGPSSFTTSNAFDNRLELKARTLKPHTLQFNQNEKSKWNVAGSKASLFMSILPVDDQKFLGDVSASSVGCVLLGRYCERCYFMIVGWNGDIAVRLGTMMVENLPKDILSSSLADRRSIRLL